ncbi:MAG: long-chain fatty acid--CoA ligase [Proteobacteria bacterium]|nr:long-chain fatty acid--CoA ligase [Pseudomonadota bacterium]
MESRDELTIQSDAPVFISAAEAATLPGLFLCRWQQTPRAPAYQQYEKQNWQTLSWEEMAVKISCWQLALQGANIDQGERIALYLHNSVEWVCCEQAALSLRLVTVPLYHLDSPENIAFILQDSGAKVLLVADHQQWLALQPFKDNLANLRLIVCVRGCGAEDSGGSPQVRPLASWLPAKAPALSNRATDPHELASIIYTSGTTGPPKGVMLSHYNILANAEMVQQVVPAYNDDIFLSFLPLSHSFERTVGYYVPMMAGAQIAFCRSIKDLAEDLLTIRPTVLISVPRIYERIYGRIHDGLKSKGAMARLLFRMAVATGWHLFEAAQEGDPGDLLDRLRWPLLHKLVAEQILDRLGGRLRLAVTGGAPLNDKVGRLFIGLGLPLLQGYGLTESAPVVSANTLTDNLPASVGRPLPGVEVKLGKDNELLIRSASVMIGYWQRPADFTAAVDGEGWLATGDVVEIDADQRLFIRGRLKEIIVTSTGEKVAPADLEAAISEDPLFYQAMVIGEARPYLAALIVLERTAWQELCLTLGHDPDDPALLSAPQITDLVLHRITTLLSGFPSYAQVRTVHLCRTSWSLKDGLVTSLLKLRRQEIEKRFRREIAALYQGHDLPNSSS